MGRKIPGRKHRGVRDPEKQAAARLNNIKDKINAPPTNPDDQQISKTLQRVIDLKNKVKSGEYGVKRKKKIKTFNKPMKQNPNEPSKEIINKYRGKPDKPIPVFEQSPGETDRNFLYRISKICENVTKEAAFEEKYGVEIKRNETGEVTDVVKRPKDELETLIKKVRKEKMVKKIKKKKKKLDVDGPRLTKSQKWQKKKNEKKLKKKLNKADEFEKYKDPIKFGETVHAPPTLIAPRKVERPKIAPRPGKKTLLLKAIITKDKSKLEKQPIMRKDDKIPKVGNKSIDKKGKRRDLPNALRRQLDNQQNEVISAYKLIKAKKYSNT